MEKIKAGIVGAGIWGETHATILNEHPLCEVVAICDLDKQKAEAAASKFNIKNVYSDYNELVKCNCDMVSIVTPDFLHGDIAVAAANAKKHILIEKPLATNREDVYRITEAVEKNNVRGMVDLHNRWSPPFNTAKQALDSGELGVPYSAYMRLNDVKWVATDMLPWAAKSSILWFLGSHTVDTVNWFFDDIPEYVYSVKREGLLKNLGVDTVDMYMTTLQYKNGGIVQIENGWITPNSNTCINDIKFNLLCTEGKVDIDASNHNLIQINTENKVYTPDILVKNNIFDQAKGFSYESIRSFVDSLYSGKEFRVSLQDAANVSLIILAIMESAQTGKPVKVNY
ncbi:MAG: Gfo/Idh/MocA family oxidoreductase [Firmicutes bacterium]|nr:Gfo/Idh/MocA family oxidoreductase [Bacillota bacterium]